MIVGRSYGQLEHESIFALQYLRGRYSNQAQLILVTVGQARAEAETEERGAKR